MRLVMKASIPGGGMYVPARIYVVASVYVMYPSSSNMHPKLRVEGRVRWKRTLVFHHDCLFHVLMPVMALIFILVLDLHSRYTVL